MKGLPRVHQNVHLQKRVWDSINRCDNGAMDWMKRYSWRSWRKRVSKPNPKPPINFR